MYKEVLKWLRQLSMPVSATYLRLRLETPPEYPSLTSIKDTLEELNIDCQVCQGTKEDLINEAKPFLAHLYIGGGYLSIAKMFHRQSGR